MSMFISPIVPGSKVTQERDLRRKMKESDTKPETDELEFPRPGTRAVL